MKALSVVIPAYNAEQFLEKCVTSVLKSSNDIEIIIVNDGSKDNTGILADRFMSSHPDKIRVIHQANAGHGGAVNAGITNATGSYIKIVDSDDWVDSTVLGGVVEKLREFISSENKVDMVVSNFVYDKVGVINKKVMHYRNILPRDEVFSWNKVRRFPVNRYILMHSVIFRRNILIKCELKLPEHTYYVDNLYVYLPLQYVKSMYYIDRPLYHYFIGRDDQSVNEKNMIRNIEQQLKVNQMMIQHVDLKEIKEKNQKRYMKHYLMVITSVTSVLLYKTFTVESMEKKKDFWRFIKAHDVLLYFKLRYSFLGAIINMPGRLGRAMILCIYKVARARIGFN